MASPFTGNTNNWSKTTPSYIIKENGLDPFFDPHSLTITNNEYKPVPLPDDDFEPFLQKFSEMDNMLNETLGFQELNIPNGYQQQQYFDQTAYMNDEKAKKHSRKISGSAIFGFMNGHSHQLSIPGIHATENSLKRMNEQIDYYNSNNMEQLSQLNDSTIDAYESKEIVPAEKSEKRSGEIPQDNHEDFIITGKTPVAFKFPPKPNDSIAQRSNQKVKMKNIRYEPKNEIAGQHSQDRVYTNDSQPSFIPPQYFEMQNNIPNSYSVEYINKLQQISRNQEIKNSETKEQRYEDNPFVDNSSSEDTLFRSPSQLKDNKNNFYLLPPENDLGKPDLGLPETNLEYSSPEEYFSSPNNSPVLHNNLFISPQHNPPQLPELQTPQKMKLPPAPKLQPASLMTPTKYTIVTKNQEDIAERYNYDSGDCLTETPKKQMIGDNEQVFWTPILITKDDPNSSKIIKDQLKRQVSVKRKETKITSTLPKGHLDQYFIGPDEEDKFVCTFNDCNKKFTRISNTRAHIQTHLSDRPFGCQLCPKSFVRHHDLRRHERSHKEFSFECPCGKKFPRQDALKRHRIRKICCGAIENEKPVSPDKKLVSKPSKKNIRPRKEDQLQYGLRDKLLEDLSYGTKGLDFEYMEAGGNLDRGDNLLLNEMGSNNDEHRNFKSDHSNVLDDFDYGSFDM